MHGKLHRRLTSLILVRRIGIRGDSCDPFDPSLCWVADVWSWLTAAILGVNGVQVVGVGGGLGTDFLHCGSIVGLISSLFDLVEIVGSTSKSGYWVCLCWNSFNGQDSNASQWQRYFLPKVTKIH